MAPEKEKKPSLIPAKVCVQPHCSNAARPRPRTSSARRCRPSMKKVKSSPPATTRKRPSRPSPRPAPWRSESMAQTYVALWREFTPRARARDAQHPNVAILWNNLAAVQAGMNKLAKAEESWRNSLRVFRASHKPDHPQISGLLNNIAWLCKTQEKYPEAAKLYEQLQGTHCAKTTSTLT